MLLTLGDLELLKQLRGAGGLGRNVRELNIRVTLDRLVKGGYLVSPPRFPSVRGSFFARLAAPSPPPRRFRFGCLRNRV